MSLLILAAVIALLALGLERNARRARHHLPLSSGWPTPHDRRDRDAERLLDELRSRG